MWLSGKSIESVSASSFQIPVTATGGYEHYVLQCYGLLYCMTYTLPVKETNTMRLRDEGVRLKWKSTDDIPINTVIMSTAYVKCFCWQRAPTQILRQTDIWYFQQIILKKSRLTFPPYMNHKHYGNIFPNYYMNIHILRH